MTVAVEESFATSSSEDLESTGVALYTAGETEIRYVSSYKFRELMTAADTMTSRLAIKRIEDFLFECCPSFCLPIDAMSYKSWLVLVKIIIYCDLTEARKKN
jgi:hypothetical protein